MKTPERKRIYVPLGDLEAAAKRLDALMGPLPPPRPSEMSLDLDDHRTSRLEKVLVWVAVVCTVVSGLGSIIQVWQAFQ